jgi:pSer/pThr/pTyr-binding forkhead associated (FHA) protein
MDGANLHKGTRSPVAAEPGELVVQNGRQAGMRRLLNAPVTFVGRGANCDIRLNVKGIDPLHCVVIAGPNGVELRDLNSADGTFVNGTRVDHVSLQQGDLVKVGPFQFRLELPLVAADSSAVEPPAADDRESLRIQAAAVVAQQIALDEEETRMRERRQALQQQEEQLSAHLAEKQRQMQLWSESNRAEREALRREKLEHEKSMEKLEQELIQARHNAQADQEKATHERQRVNKVYQRLRVRWQKHWGAEKVKQEELARKLKVQAAAVADLQQELDAKEASLAQEILRFNKERDAGRRELGEDRAALKQAQERSRKRRARERLALKARDRAIAVAHVQLQTARQLVEKDRDAWQKQQQSLQSELHGLNNRIVHQRMRIQKQEDEIARLDQVLQAKRAIDAPPATPILNDQGAKDHAEPVAAPSMETHASHANAPVDSLESRQAGLERLSADLADQRVQILEYYQQLTELHRRWQTERGQAADELDAVAQRLIVQEETTTARDQESIATEERLRKRQEEIDALRTELQTWRARLRTREKLNDEEYDKQRRLLNEKEKMLEAQTAALVQVRERWNRRRKQELEKFETSRSSLHQQQKDAAQLRAGLLERIRQIEDEKRILAEKALALEQYRQETFARADDPIAERRVERLRRRWLALNAGLIRAAKNEHETALQELARLEADRAELVQQHERVTRAEALIAEKQSLLDERDALLKARQQQLELDRKTVQWRTQDAGQSSLRIQDEQDAVAKAVYAGDDQPVEKAA